MARIVGIAGVTHNPLMWSMLREDPPPDLDGTQMRMRDLARRIREVGPDILVVVASDHLHMQFTSNMPAFMVGKAPEMRAGFPSEKRSFGLPPGTVRGHPALAAHLLGGEELTGSIDFAFSDEPWLDHSFLVPLLLLTPAFDIPVVPVFTNANSPPIPTAARFAALGDHLRSAIDSYPGSERVVVLGSGHFAHELGGPRQFLGVSPDPGFDQEAVGWMRDGDLAAAQANATFARLTAAGNESYQFLNFVTCLATAEGRGAQVAVAEETRFGGLPFLWWDTP